MKSVVLGDPHEQPRILAYGLRLFVGYLRSFAASKVHGMRHRIEVRGVNAVCLTAKMVEFLTIWDRPDFLLVHRAVGVDLFAVHVDLPVPSA